MTFFSCHWLLSPEFVVSYLLQLEPTGTELLPIGHSLGAGIKDGEMKAASHSTSTARCWQSHLDRSNTPRGSQKPVLHVRQSCFLCSSTSHLSWQFSSSSDFLTYPHLSSSSPFDEISQIWLLLWALKRTCIFGILITFMASCVTSTGLILMANHSLIYTLPSQGIKWWLSQNHVVIEW